MATPCEGLATSVAVTVLEGADVPEDTNVPQGHSLVRIGRLTATQHEYMVAAVEAQGGTLVSCTYVCDVPGCTAAQMKERAPCKCGEHDVCPDHMTRYLQIDEECDGEASSEVMCGRILGGME